MKLLEGKTVLVTGSSRGIGAASAKLLAANGAKVVVNYSQSEGAAKKVVEEIAGAGGKAIAVHADISDPAQIRQLIAQTVDAFGGLDVLVLNAGFGFPTVPFLQYKWEDFERKIVGEVKSAFFFCKEVVPMMQEKKAGSIIFVSSSLSRNPGPGFIAHSSTKSAIDAFAKSLALEHGPDGIRVNVVAPGLTETDSTAEVPAEAKQMSAAYTPLRRNAQPEDIAGVILMLASDQTRFMTGTYVPVCGGNLMI